MDNQNIINQTFLKSNITEEDEAKEEIKNALKQISDATCKSLGPYGSTTIIQDREGKHKITKDGYTILSNMNYYYDIPKTILDMVQKISRTLVRTVGDGSTSSVKIAYELFIAIDNLVNTNAVAPQDIITILNELSIIFEGYIRDEAIKLTDDNFDEIITRVASISTNNDTQAGKLISEIFKKVGKYSFINLENGTSVGDRYELVDGIEVDRGYINQIMANLEDKFSFEYKDAMVFMCNDMLDDMEMEWVANLIGEVALKKDIPIIFIAGSYSSSFKSFFYANKQKNKTLPIVAIDIDTGTKRGKERFDDLALVLGCHYYDKFNGDDKIDDFTVEDLGVCERVIGNDLHTKFMGGYGYKNDKESIDKRIADLEEQYSDTEKLDQEFGDKDYELFLIKKRIAMLQCSMATLYVGGNTPTERDTRKFLMEDAVYACRSTIDNGYVVGGNLILPKIIYQYSEAIIYKLMNNDKLHYMHNIFSSDSDLHNFYNTVLQSISSAFESSFAQVLSNANIQNINSIIERCKEQHVIYNVKSRIFENDKETMVINSVDTDIEIIKASFSIIGLLATSNQFITTNAISTKRQ
jgi:chaperonin GroEL